MSGPNSNNQKGMFENSTIRNAIVKPYFRDINVDPLGQYPLPDISKLPIPGDWKARVQQVMLEQGYKDGPWMYKGAKMCLHWPVWHYAFPNAKWIIVRRRNGDIADSCVKTGFMRAFRNETTQRIVGAKNEREGWLWWIRQHLDRFVEMIESEDGPNCKQIWPHRMVQADYQQLYEVIDWLGLKWNPEILNFIDNKLWHSRRVEEDKKVV